MTRIVIAAAVVASISGLAQADPFTGSLAPSQWSLQSNTWGTTGVSQDTPDTLKLTYNMDGNTDPYFMTVLTEYSVVSDHSGAITVDFQYDMFHSWFMASAELWAFSDGVNGRSSALLFAGGVSGGASITGSAALNVEQGYAWGFIAGGSHFDGSNALSGTVTLSNLVPAPGSAALFGLGALSITRRRRR